MAPPTLSPVTLITWPPPPGTTAAAGVTSQIFGYENVKTKRVAGAFRLVDVKALLNNQISILEFQNITWETNVKDTKGKNHSPLEYFARSGYRYVALSHVWEFSSEVQQELDAEKSKYGRGDCIDIAVDKTDRNNGVQVLRWQGLKQAAEAVNSVMLGHANYLWLDFLCIDQIKRLGTGALAGQDLSDKPGQLCLMADVYRYASGTVIMIGGMPSVQSTTTQTAWMDRAWTLQEVVANGNNHNNWVYVKWGSSLPHNIPAMDPTRPTRAWRFHTVSTIGADNLCLIELRDLLELADTDPSKLPPLLPSIVVLDGMANTKVPGLTSGAGGRVARHALRAALSPNSRVQNIGVWRSIFLRTSSWAADVVYSMMGCLGQQIDPSMTSEAPLEIDKFRKNRTPAFLFNDLCRKTAARGWPAWLTIGGVKGSDLPFQYESGIIPKFPHTQEANEESKNTPPEMMFGNKREWVGFHVDDSPFYIKKFDVVFVTHSQPHVINACMIKVKAIRRRFKKQFRGPTPTQHVKRKVATLVLKNGVQGRLIFWGNDYLRLASKRRIFALYVGDIGDMNKIPDKRGPINFPPSPDRFNNLNGDKYLLFLEYDKSTGAWSIIANGAFRPNAKSKWSSKPRYTFTMGIGSQSQVPIWRTVSRTSTKTKKKNWPDDPRSSKFKVHSYGLQSLRNLERGGGIETEPPIHWVGILHKMARNYKFKKFKVKVDLAGLSEEGIQRVLEHKTNLLVVSCRTNDPPKDATIDEDAPRISKLGAYQMPYSYDGWDPAASTRLRKGVNGVEGLVIPKFTFNPAGGSTSKTLYYWMKIWFAKRVMYVMTKTRRRTPRAYQNIYIVPYARMEGVTINRNYGFNVSNIA